MHDETSDTDPEGRSGANSVVVGTAITDPTWITAAYVGYLERNQRC